MKLKTYYWKNQHQQGEIKSLSIHYAKAILLSQHIEWQSIKRHYRFNFTIHRISSKHIADLLMQLSHLLQSHFTLLHAIQALMASNTQPALLILLKHIESTILAGNPLSYALRSYPNYFNAFTCELIRLGETCGNLNEVLQALYQTRQKNLLFINKLKQAAFYPCLVAGIAILITIGMLNYVVPQFAEFYQAFSGNLPILTQWIITIACQLHHHGVLIFSSSLFFICLMILLIKQLLIVRVALLQLMLRLPVMGSLIQKILLLRYFRSLHLLINSSMPILPALELLKTICLHPSYFQLFDQASQKIKAGYSLAESLSHTPYIPKLLLELIKTGEITGRLDAMLMHAIFFYEQDLDQQLNRLQQLIEPVLLITLSCIIMLILLAIYLPIFNVGNII